MLHGFLGWRVAVVTANGFCDVVGVVTDGYMRHMAAPWAILVCSLQLLLSRRRLLQDKKFKSASTLMR